MQVFLCWSGPVSHAIAEALNTFLGDTINELKPFFSTESIRKGAKWGIELSKQLSACNFGILCLTRDNLAAPWILFEAGALSKHITESRVTAILAGIKSADITDPLSQFHHTRFDKGEIHTLVKQLNELLPEAHRVGYERLDRMFAKNWPDLESKFDIAMKLDTSTAAPITRPTEDMVAELLELVRGIKQQSDIAQARAVFDRASRRLGNTAWLARNLQGTELPNTNLSDADFETKLKLLVAALPPESRTKLPDFVKALSTKLPNDPCKVKE